MSIPAALHPAQISVYEQAFRPDPAEVERTSSVLWRYEETWAAGRGAAVDDHGHMIDKASIKMARAVIAAAEN